MKRILMILLLVGAVILTACERTSGDKMHIANPASEFCTSNDGVLDIRTADDGSQTGYCKIAGKECEEWSLFRGECTEAHICTDEEKQAEICTMEYMPVCGSNGETYGNKCGACAAGSDYWTAGECV